jgi:hypothetical protein
MTPAVTAHSRLSANGAYVAMRGLTLRSAHADNERTAGVSGRLRRTRQRAHDPAQYSLGPGTPARYSP